MELIKDYMGDAVLRRELNALTRETFGFDFEDWFGGGYCEGDYIPYSYEENGRLLANVSVNRMAFMQNGRERRYIQLGTVMTREAYRNRGLAAGLMKTVLADYAGSCDGLYLFGNLGALGFYDKMGFVRGVQYRYALKDALPLRERARRRAEGECFRPAGTSERARRAYEEAVRHSAVNSAFEQTNRYGLQMFYTSSMERVYYCGGLDCYAVLEWEGAALRLCSVVCTESIRLEQVLSHIREEYGSLTLGFTPSAGDARLFVSQLYDGGDDYRLFLYGEKLKSIETEKLYFPELSHA